MNPPPTRWRACPVPRGRRRAARARWVAWCLGCVCAALLSAASAAAEEEKSGVPTTAALLVDLAKDHGLNKRGDQSAGDFQYVITLLRAAARVDPDLPDVYRWLYEAQALAGDQNGAVVSLGKLVKAEPDNTRAFELWLDSRLAAMQTVEERRDGLAKILQQGGLANELQAIAYLRSAAVALDSLDRDRARMALDRALACDPDNLEGAHLRLELLPESTPPHVRVKAALLAFETNPLNVETAWYLARLLNDYGFGDDAGRFFDHALDVFRRANPGQPIPCDRLLDLAVNAAARGFMDKAEEFARQAVNAAPSYAPAQMQLHWLLNKRGHSDEAAQISKALAARFAQITDPAAAPLDEVAQAAWFLCSVDPRPKPALAMAQAAAQRAPDDPFVKRSLGWAMAMNQRLKDAGKALVDIAPHDPFAAYQLARILADNGEQAAARRILDNLAAVPAGGPAADLLASLGSLCPTSQPAAKRFPEIADAMTDLDSDLLAFHKEPARFLKAEITPATPNFAPGESWWVTFSLTNTGSFPVTLGPDWMINPVFLVSFGVEGDRSRQFADQFTVALEKARRLKPGQTLSLREAIDLGPIRRVSRLAPQQLLRVTVRAILDPQATPDGRWIPALTGQTVESVVFNRVPVRTGGNGVQSLLANLESEDPQKSLGAIEVLAELLGEAQRAAAKKMPYDPAQVPEARIRQALMASLLGDSWEKRVRALDALFVAGLDEKMLDAIRRCLRHEHWLVRLMAVRLLGEREGKAFAPSARTISTDDPDDLVRDMAKSFLDRWEAATSQPAKGG